MNDERGLTPNYNPVSLAIRACLLNGQEAQESWNQLLKDSSFESLPLSVIRILPAIYDNLKACDDLAERERLTGVYRASWSTNILRFGASLELIRALNSTGIDYRLLKGASVAMLSSWGTRRMGDIDLIVNSPDEDRLARILYQLNFKLLAPEGTNTSQNNSTRTELIEGMWINSLGSVIDIHSTNKSHPVFDGIFHEEGQHKESLGCVLRIPSPALMFALAIWHGQKGTSITDETQTLVDLGLLLNEVNISETISLLKKSGLRSAALTYLKTLSNLGIPVSPAWNELERLGQSEILDQIRIRIRLLRATLMKLGSIVAISKKRRISAEQRSLLAQCYGPKIWLYRLWCSLGQVRPLEQYVCELLGGFLAVHQNAPTGGFLPERDYRIHVTTQTKGVVRIRIAAKFEQVDPLQIQHRALFINGKLHGFLPLTREDYGIYEIEIRRPEIEISLRTFRSDAYSPIISCEVEVLEISERSNSN